MQFSIKTFCKLDCYEMLISAKSVRNPWLYLLRGIHFLLNLKETRLNPATSFSGCLSTI